MVAAEVTRRIFALRIVRESAILRQALTKPYPFREQTAEYAENKRWNRTFSTRPRSSNSEGANWLSMATTAAVSFSVSSAYSAVNWSTELIRLSWSVKGLERSDYPRVDVR